MFDPVFITLACGPLLIAQVAVAGASAAAGYAAQRANAKAIEGHQRAVGASMGEQHASNMTDSLARQNEAATKAARDREQIQRKAFSVASTARTSALGSGIGGNTYAALMQEYDQREAELMQASYLNEDLLENRYRREREQAALGTQARLLSNYRPINQPSGVAAALDFAGDSMSAYSDFKIRTA